MFGPREQAGALNAVVRTLECGAQVANFPQNPGVKSLGLGFKGFRSQDLGFRIYSLGFRVLGFRA